MRVDIIKLVKLIRALAEFHTKLEVINVLSELSVTPHTSHLTPYNLHLGGLENIEYLYYCLLISQRVSQT